MILTRSFVATIVVEAREAGAGKFELLPVEHSLGLTRLPEPSVGDIFFDIDIPRQMPVHHRGGASREYLPRSNGPAAPHPALPDRLEHLA
jgi:hypothetical protein